MNSSKQIKPRGKKNITEEPEVVESLLRTEVETPIEAESSREVKRGWEMSDMSSENRRIPAGNCKTLPETGSLSTTEDEVSTELMRVFVEASTRGFLLPTIANHELQQV